MAIEKSLYAAPMGLDTFADMQAREPVALPMPPSGIPPELIELEDGSVEITLIPDLLGDAANLPFDANLADYLEDNVLNTLSQDLISLVDADINGRKDWADTFVKGLEVLGLKYEDRTDPWMGSCGVFSTVLAEAAIRFQAETMSETFPAAGPVKTKIIGEITRDKEDAATRVKADMNYELTDVMVEYRPEHERMLYTLGLAGSAFKKVYFDPAYGRQVAFFIPPEDVIVPYGASHIESAERVTHVMRKTPNEIKRLQSSGFYRDVDLGEPTPYHSDIEEKKAEEGGYTLTDDNRYALYEIHADLVIEGFDEEEELAKPYVVTIDKGTGTVLAVRRNWDPADELQRKQQFFVHYVYVPGFGFYGLGLIHIVGGYARAGTSLIRQLVDAGTLSNLPGGLKTRGLRIKGDDTPIPPGEFRDVDVPSGSIRDNIMPLPYKEPSQTLLALLNQITEEGRRLGAISDMNISDMSANAPVGTTLALLERTLKPMAAVQSRVHYAMKQEFKLLHKIIAEYAPTEYTYVPDRGEPRARQADYAMVTVIPVSDPNSSTMAQRVVQYQAVLQMAHGSPQIYDLPQLHRQMIEVLGIKNADKLVPTKEDITPTDPVSENMGCLVGKPIKAFIYQDHDAHIATHQSFLQDPQIAAFVGQSPAAQQVQAALSAHIAEHVAFSYRKQIEMKLGVQLAEPGKEMAPEAEVLLSQVMAQAAQQVTMEKQKQAAQQAAQKQMQDPVIQMQMQELQLKGAEVQRKGAKDAADVALAQEKLDVERQRIAAQSVAEAARIKSQSKQAASKMQLDIAKELLAAAQSQQQKPKSK